MAMARAKDRVLRDVRRLLTIAAAAALIAAPTVLHAISAARCARKCTYVTGACIVERGQQCTDAVPAAPCLQSLDQQCQQEAVAACVESHGKRCKRRSCRQWRKLYCDCEAEAAALGADPGCALFLPARCRPARCPTTTTTTTTTMPPLSVTYCCYDRCANGGCALRGDCVANLGLPCCLGHDGSLVGHCVDFVGGACQGCQ